MYAEAVSPLIVKHDTFWVIVMEVCIHILLFINYPSLEEEFSKENVIEVHGWLKKKIYEM